MANDNGWGDGAANNSIGWGQGANNNIGWGDIHADSWAGLTDISGAPSVDADAQAFITAASITDATQQSAINQLVVDLKGYGIWTKMKALYPFVGGTASTHKFNLKDPRDLDAAFRLVFNGGWTHSSTGALPNGTNAFANTYFTEQLANANNQHISTYLRTNVDEARADIGVVQTGVNGETNIISRLSNQSYFRVHGANSTTVSNTDSRGLFIANRPNNTTIKAIKNLTITTISNTSVNISNIPIFLGCYNFNGTATAFSSKQTAFASIGDGLSDTEAANFYTAVQAFQVTLGRSIGTQTVSDADAQAFVTNANIQDQVQATAINNLVIGLKADSLWTKMKAIYPFVGGDATSHKFNLKNPLDTNAAFRLVFSGGWTHNANGAKPNGTNAYADTFLIPSSIIGSVNSNSIGYYSGTNLSETISDPTNIGAYISGTQSLVILKQNSTLTSRINGGTINFSSATMKGFFSGSRQSSTVTNNYINGSQVATGNSGGNLPTTKIYIGTISADISNTPYSQGYVVNDFRFSYISDGLSNNEMSNLYTAVQAFQVALNRNV